jgi:hypothetical protein
MKAADGANNLGSLGIEGKFRGQKRRDERHFQVQVQVQVHVLIQPLQGSV